MSCFIQCDVVKCDSVHAIDESEYSMVGSLNLPVGWMIIKEMIEPKPTEPMAYEAHAVVNDIPQHIQSAIRMYDPSAGRPTPKTRYMCPKHKKPAWKGGE